MLTRSNGLSGSQPLKWHGGKYYLANKIIEAFPKHTHYVEPYFGGGSVFFAKPMRLIDGHSEIINDIHSELTNFWTVLRDDDMFEKFGRLVDATPFSKVVWSDAMQAKITDPIERAWAFFVRYRQSRQGLGDDFATMSRSRTRRGMNEQVSSWLSAIEGLPEVHARLKRVVIFNENAVELIEREDSMDTFYYLDPPYLHATRIAKNSYEHEMTFEQHEELLTAIGRLRGKFLLSGYPSSLYDGFATKHGWSRIDIEIDNKASSLKVKPIKTECLWRNY